MNKSKFVKFISLALCILMPFSSLADYKDIVYFNDLTPQKVLNKIYPEERKKALAGSIIDYNDVEDMIHLYNPDILNMWNSWENNKSSQDIYKDYMDTADALSISASSQENDLQEGMLQAQVTAAKIQADLNADDSYTKFLTNYLTEKGTVLATKLLIISYNKSKYDLEVAKEAVKEAARKEESGKNAYDYGQGTYVEYLTAKKNAIDANSALVAAESAEKTAYRNVLLNCGKSMNANCTINDVDLNVDEYIASINLENDYNTALKNNIQYEIYKRKLANAQTDEVKNQFKILVDNAPKKLRNIVETRYAAIFDALDTRKNKEAAYELAKDTLKKAENEFNSGNISKKAYLTAEYGVTVAKSNIESAKYDLKSAVEQYKAIVSGQGES